MTAQFPGWCVVASYQRRDLRSLDDRECFLRSSQAVSKSLWSVKCARGILFSHSHEPRPEARGEARRVMAVAVGGVGASISPLHRAASGLAVRPAGQAGEELLQNLPLSPLISSFLLLSVSITVEQLFPPRFF